MPDCLIALGGNISVSEQTFLDAQNLLNQESILVRQLSPVCRTHPVGANAGTEFLNAALSATTELSAVEVLAVLHDVEGQFGRTRELHWGPRTLDLDLILYDQVVIETDVLTVPHPAAWYRRFVLEPACSVASEMIHPGFGQSIGQLYRRLIRRPLVFVVGGDQSELWYNLSSTLEQKYGDLVHFRVEFDGKSNAGALSSDPFARLQLRGNPKIKSQHPQSQPYKHHDFTIEIDASKALPSIRQAIDDVIQSALG